MIMYHIRASPKECKGNGQIEKMCTRDHIIHVGKYYGCCVAAVTGFNLKN